MKTLILIFLGAAAAFAAPTFTQSPSMTGSGPYQISFAVSETTDVEVSIVDPADSTVVRHLAAGMLGGNAPAPLAKNSLSQTLSWDGKDDYGNTVSSPGSLRARVRAGMSVAFHQAVGFHPYSFARYRGLCADRQNGRFLVYGESGQLHQMAIRQYDAAADYVRTVYPYSGHSPADDVRGYGINMFPDGVSYAPKSCRTVAPEMDYSIMGNVVVLGANPYMQNAGYRTILTVYAVNGRFAVIDPETLEFLLVQSTGAVGTSGAPTPVLRSPVVNGPFTGPVQVQISPDGNYFWVSGVNSSGLNGKVMRADIATGTATAVINVGMGPMAASEAATQGLAFDGAGHVFVCDRLNHLVRTYDTTGTLLDSLAVQNPYLVDVNLKTGELYVATRLVTGTDHSGIVSLYKYSSWHASAAVTASLPNFLTAAEYQVFMALSESPAAPVLCLTSSAYNKADENNAWFVRDDGNAFTVFKNFYNEARGINNGFDRVMVDRETEVCFINDSWSGMFKVDDWHNPRVLACTTSTGQRIWAGSFAISPDRELYVRTDESNGRRGSGFTGPVDVYSLEDHRHVYKRQAISSIYGRYGPGGYADRGLAVLPSGNIAVMYMEAWDDYIVSMFSPSGSNIGTLVNPIARECGGIKFDLQGNLYVGAYIIDMSHQVPGSGFAGDQAYWRATGSVVKFPPQGGAISATEIYNYQRTATNELMIYPYDYAPISGTPGTENCRCRSPRFDLDPYGRLFIPSAFTCKVAVADNAGNGLAQVGRYGNVDDPLNEIPLAWPVGAAASEDYLYVTDMVNSRLMRLKMSYVLDNMPGLTEHGTEAERMALPASGAKLLAAPNPFRSAVTVACGLAPGISGEYRIFNMRGQAVFSAVIGAGRFGRYERIHWQGRDLQGKALPSGCYAGVLRLSNGHMLRHKLIMMK